ncbi:Uu.00g108500.m01.CDS01 [Anthostomella pinea]|uniref:Uu.00g108500.m01.CDS01 n=1 Tax=Anthostomella pinea TaxID=933095 RepID=A0AAI8VEF2_9PEZI|nr:Uu.00g108500.m01.CDS01 [Anthostomella pinea]
MAARDSPFPDLSIADQLDNEIANLRAQVESLRKDLKLQTATLMTSESTRQLLQISTNKGARSNRADDATKQKLLERAEEHNAHKQQSLYRACASITTFKARDPDPNAVDGGSILGLRFEVMSKSRFLKPYYVMLNRPYSNSRHLRIHRHTVPQCIPLSGLAARHLPAPSIKNDGGTSKMQDLSQFVRTLRRELVRYQNRIAVIGDLRKAAGLEAKNDTDRESELVNISLAGPMAKQIHMEWSDGRSGRLVMGDDGEILKMAVQGQNGQDRETVRNLLGRSVRIEEVVKQLEGV